MSADNYIFVRKRADGKFGVSMRFASDVYSDEVEDSADASAEEPEDRYGIFDTAEEAVIAAHEAYRTENVVEYGVLVSDSAFS